MARLIIRTLERIVSVPGTLDDLKKWWKVLGALFLSVVQWWEKARAWLAGATVSRAEWVATVDMGLWWVGTIAGILAVLMLLGPVNTKGQFVVYWGYEDHRVPISSDRGLLTYD